MKQGSVLLFAVCGFLISSEFGLRNIIYYNILKIDRMHPTLRGKVRLALKYIILLLAMISENESERHREIQRTKNTEIE